MKHNIAWFDIPVIDLDRAIRFYAAVLGAPVKKENTGSVPLGLLPTSDGQHMGCLVANDNSKPSANGVMVWFGVSGRLKEAVMAVKPNGGTVLQDVHAIGTHGFRAEVLDSEGNCIALYSETET